MAKTIKHSSEALRELSKLLAKDSRGALETSIGNLNPGRVFRSGELPTSRPLGASIESFPYGTLGGENPFKFAKKLTRPQAPKSAVDTFGDLLRHFGIDSKVRGRLLSSYKSSADTEESIDLTLLTSIIGQELKLGYPKGKGNRTLALVGPTGVGKTTTIHKLGAIAALHKKLSVGFITIDTRRVGGAEQLEQAGDLIGAETLTASTASELLETREHFASKDLIFIDTAGSGPWDESRIRELREVLGTGTEAGNGIERMLLLPASGNSPDLRHTLSAFRGVGIQSIGVTKTDETSYFGPCLNILFEAGLQIELFGTGQRVPEDIEAASAEKIVQLLVRRSDK